MQELPFTHRPYSAEELAEKNRRLQEELSNPAGKLSYRELQVELKKYRVLGTVHSSFKLNQKKVVLAAEYNRITIQARDCYNEVMSSRQPRFERTKPRTQATQTAESWRRSMISLRRQQMRDMPWLELKLDDTFLAELDSNIQMQIEKGWLVP